MELTSIWEVIERRKWIIIQALILITLVAFLGSYLITPSYQASSKIMITRVERSTSEAQDIGLSALSSIITASPNVDVNKIIATSKPIIDRMVSKLQLRDEEGNLIEAKNLTQTGMVSTIKRRISPKPLITISRYQDTDILQFTASSPDPEEAMMLANTLSETMVNENQTQTRAEYRSAQTFLEDQIQKVKERYNVALRNLTDFRKKEKTIDLTIETKLASEKMAELLQQKEDNIIDLAEARARLNSIKSQLAQQSLEIISASAVKENPLIEALKKRLTDLQLELAAASSELTDRHPRVSSIKDRIKLAEKELKRAIETYKTSAPELAALERQIAALEVHLQQVNADIDKYMQSLGGLPEKAFNQANLDMELNVSKGLYSTLLDYLYQVGTAEATTLSQIRVVDPAVRPMYPVSPNKLLNGLLGLFLGLVFGVGLAFFFEYLDDSVRTPEDVKEFKPTALIGLIPLLKKNENPLISERDPSDPFYECYRKIRTHIRYVRGTSLKSLMIICAGPGEGKSTTIVNLGISMAHEGQQVAIVDVDLSRPTIHTYLDLPNDVGVTNVLEGNALIDEAIQRTSIQGLSVVTSGQPPSDPGKLIESDRMEWFMSELKSRFDIVLMDSAPMLVRSDALILTRYSDGTIILLESGKTTRHAIHALLETMANASIEPLGFILNKMPIGKGKFLYHEYYYGYYGKKYIQEKTR